MRFMRSSKQRAPREIFFVHALPASTYDPSQRDEQVILSSISASRSLTSLTITPHFLSATSIFAKDILRLAFLFLSSSLLPRGCATHHRGSSISVFDFRLSIPSCDPATASLPSSAWLRFSPSPEQATGRSVTCGIVRLWHDHIHAQAHVHASSSPSFVTFSHREFSTATRSSAFPHDTAYIETTTQP